MTKYNKINYDVEDYVYDNDVDSLTGESDSIIEEPISLEETEKHGYTTDDYKLKLRSNHNSNASVIKVLEPHTPVTIIDDSNSEWLKIMDDNHDIGFVMESYVSID